ncbi:MAG: LAGLIDADG family homing endonuclease [Candidatus Aenigmatarchaeota archaeon]
MRNVATIPHEPNMKFPRYLDKLYTNEQGTKGNDFIRLYGMREFLRNAANCKRKEMAQFLNVDVKRLNYWIGESKRDVGIPIYHALKLVKFIGADKDELFDKAIWFGCTNSRQYTLPKFLTPRLAYLLGYIMGDGHLANPKNLISNGSTYNAEIRITGDNIAHLIFLRKIFKELFNYSPPIFKEKNFYRLIGRSKVIHLFLTKVCGMPVGSKKNKTCMPSIIKINFLKKLFLSGLFDADGTIHIGGNKQPYIRIKQHNKRLLKECAHIFHDNGIKVSGIYTDKGFRNGTKTVNYVLIIYRKEEIEKFIRQFFSLKVQEVMASQMT